MSAVTATIKNLDKGSEIDATYEVMSIDIIKEVRRVPYARLVLLDGNAAKGSFEVSNSGFFDTGSNFEIMLKYEGSPDEEETVFKGIVVKHSIKASSRGSFLTIQMKNKAYEMTKGKQNFVYKKRTDSEIIGDILETYPISCDIDKSRIKHSEMVQYNCTDWDFIHVRAEASGLVLFTDDEEITGKNLKDLSEYGNIIKEEPDVYHFQELLNAYESEDEEDSFDDFEQESISQKKEIVHMLEYGKDEIYDFEFETDIQNKYKKGIVTRSWNMNEMKTSQSKSTESIEDHDEEKNRFANEASIEINRDYFMEEKDGWLEDSSIFE